MHLEPVGDKGGKFIGERSDEDFYLLSSQTMYRLGKAQTEGKPEFILKHQANDSEGRATQRKRIARAGWLFADRKKRYQRINFVGERDNDAVGRRGAAVIRTQRPVA